MNAIVQTKRILPEERAKIWNRVTRKTVAIGMIIDKSIYPYHFKNHYYPILFISFLSLANPQSPSRLATWLSVHSRTSLVAVFDDRLPFSMFPWKSNTAFCLGILHENARDYAHRRTFWWWSQRTV